MILTAHKTAHKTGRPRLIILPPDAVALLSRLKAKHPTGPLLRNTLGRAWGEKPLVKAMIATRARAGVKHATCYGYRHSLATDALASGVPDTHVAALLGHQGTGMLHKHYSHLTSKTNTLREALANVRR